MVEPQFPRLGPEQWAELARHTFEEQGGAFVPRYDPKLARLLKGISMTRALPSLWPQFEALAAAPLMVIRGTNSDILSAETVAAMRARRPDLVAVEVPDQGHAPLLDDGDTIESISEFIEMC